MEKDILNIINSNNNKDKKEIKEKEISILFKDVKKLDKDRTKNVNYNSEVSKLVKIC